MSQHARQHVVVPSCKFSYFVLIHPQLGLGFFEALLYGPPDTAEPNKGLEPRASGGIAYVKAVGRVSSDCTLHYQPNCFPWQPVLLPELQGRQTHTDLHGHFIRATCSTEGPYHSAMDEMDINELTYLVNGAIFEVNRELWEGFLEKVYKKHRRVRRERREICFWTRITRIARIREKLGDVIYYVE